MKDDVTLFLVEYAIDGRQFCCRLPAKSFEHAEQLAKAVGGRVLGNNIHEITAIPVDWLMQFVEMNCEERPRWKFNAFDQIQAFLSNPFPVRPPEEIDPE